MPLRVWQRTMYSMSSSTVLPSVVCTFTFLGPVYTSSPVLAAATTGVFGFSSTGAPAAAAAVAIVFSLRVKNEEEKCLRLSQSNTPEKNKKRHSKEKKERRLKKEKVQRSCEKQKTKVKKTTLKKS